jgi:hypothetical protein
MYSVPPTQYLSLQEASLASSNPHVLACPLWTTHKGSAFLILLL